MKDCLIFLLKKEFLLFDKAVVSLRKALVFNDKNLTSEIYYVLGKAYYHKGHFYTDLAVKYLELSIANTITAKMFMNIWD